MRQIEFAEEFHVRENFVELSAQHSHAQLGIVGVVAASTGRKALRVEIQNLRKIVFEIRKDLHTCK